MGHKIVLLKDSLKYTDSPTNDTPLRKDPQGNDRQIYAQTEIIDSRSLNELYMFAYYSLFIIIHLYSLYDKHIL